MAWDPPAVRGSRPDWDPHRGSGFPEAPRRVRQTASLRAALPGTASLRMTPSWASVPGKEACAPATGKTNAYYWALPTNVLRSIGHIGGLAAVSDQTFRRYFFDLNPQCYSLVFWMMPSHCGRMWRRGQMWPAPGFAEPSGSPPELESAAAIMPRQLVKRRSGIDPGFQIPGTSRIGRHQTTVIHSRGRRPS